MSFLTAVVLLILALSLFSGKANGSGRRFDPCVRAFNSCDFRFQSRDLIPLVTVDGPFDVAISPRIISKSSGEYIGHVNYTIGVLNSNNIPAEVITFRSFPITRLRSSPPLTPTHIKPYSIPFTTGSGVGYQTLSPSQKSALRHQCIRLFFTEYQVLDRFGNVIDNENNVPRSANKCVVFRFC